MFSSNPGAFSAPGHRHAGKEPKKIAPKLILRGDALPCLATLDPRFRSDESGASTFEELADSPVSLIIGRDASRTEKRRSLSTLLQEVTLECVALSSKLPKLRHVIVVLANPGVSDSIVLTACEQAASRLCEQVAREHGDYLVTTFLLVADCDDPALLARRIRDRAAQPQATDSACALTWDDIRAVSIEFAAMNRYV